MGLGLGVARVTCSLKVRRRVFTGRHRLLPERRHASESAWVRVRVRG